MCFRKKLIITKLCPTRKAWEYPSGSFRFGQNYRYCLQFSVLLLCGALISGCSHFGVLEGRYQTACEEHLENPNDSYGIELLEKNTRLAKFPPEPKNDGIPIIICLSYLEMGAFYREKGDILREEEVYLKALETSKDVGYHLPYPSGKIYESLRAVYRQEMLKRQSYFALRELYIRINEPILASIVEAQLQLSHVYLTSPFFQQERDVVERYERMRQGVSDEQFISDVGAVVLMFGETIVVILEMAVISLEQASGEITQAQAEAKMQQAEEDYQKRIEKIEKAAEVQKRAIQSHFNQVAFRPLLNSAKKLSTYPDLQELDSYNKIKKIVNELKNQPRETYDLRFVELMGKYQEQLLQMYQEIRAKRQDKIH